MLAGTLQTSFLLCQLTSCEALLIGNATGTQRLEEEEGTCSFLSTTCCFLWASCLFVALMSVTPAIFPHFLMEVPSGSKSWVQFEVLPIHRTSLSTPPPLLLRHHHYMPAGMCFPPQSLDPSLFLMQRHQHQPNITFSLGVWLSPPWDSFFKLLNFNNYSLFSFFSQP